MSASRLKKASALLVLTDRTILLTKLKKVTSGKLAPMADHIIDQLFGIPLSFIKMLTFDNDKAFAKPGTPLPSFGARSVFLLPVPVPSAE